MKNEEIQAIIDKAARPLKINFGSGDSYLEGFLNIDIEESQKPDLIWDIRKATLPIKANHVHEVWCHHVIEHIELRHWHHIFGEFDRVLVDNGLLFMSYPEWDICAQYFHDNHKGLKEFWQACLYGRQLYSGDYHVTPVQSEELEYILRNRGFKDIKTAPQQDHEYYTFLRAYKGQPFSKEDILRKEVLEN